MLCRQTFDEQVLSSSIVCAEERFSSQKQFGLDSYIPRHTFPIHENRSCFHRLGDLFI
jgi:hypothetical protein